MRGATSVRRHCARCRRTSRAPPSGPTTRTGCAPRRRCASSSGRSAPASRRGRSQRGGTGAPSRVESYPRGGITEGHGVGQVALLAGRRRSVQRLSGPARRRHRPARLRQRRVRASCAEHVDYVDVDAVVLSHLHADHILDLVPFSYALTYAPRQQPVPVHIWPGTDTPARPALHAPPGADRGLPPHRRRLGQRGPGRERLPPARVRPARDADDRPADLPLPLRPALLPTWAIEVTRRVERFTYGADCSPTETSSSSRATPTCC